ASDVGQRAVPIVDGVLRQPGAFVLSLDQDGHRRNLCPSAAPGALSRHPRCRQKGKDGPGNELPSVHRGASPLVFENRSLGAVEKIATVLIGSCRLWIVWCRTIISSSAPEVTIGDRTSQCRNV